MPYIVGCRLCGHIYISSSLSEGIEYLRIHIYDKHGVWPYPPLTGRRRNIKLYGPHHKVVGAITWIKDKQILQLWQNPESRKLLVQTWLRNKLIRVFNR